ncbi:MAG TPA: hypothetical protein VKS79_18780 [Gemmataceae bacterium]|nr:hypothetical protein [Gemmataceae bacterium]
MASTKPPFPAFDTSEIAILARVLSNGKEFAPALARHLLQLEFNDEEKGRINELAARNQEGLLSVHEQAELRGYANSGCLLGVLHAKARRVLRSAAKKPGRGKPTWKRR